MKGILVECLDCKWQGDGSELEGVPDDLDNASYCPKCGSPEIIEIDDEEDLDLDRNDYDDYNDYDDELDDDPEYLDEDDDRSIRKYDDDDETDYDDDDEEEVTMVCQNCGFIPTEEEIEEGVCAECGSTRFIREE